MGKKWVYLFDELDQVNAYVGGSWDAVRGLLGGKGANLAEMTSIGLPVPPGFTVTTEEEARVPEAPSAMVPE